MEAMITAEEALRLSQSKEKIVFLDVRFDLKDHHYGAKEYAKGHIPGAIFVDFEKDLVMQNPTFGGNHPFLTQEAFDLLFKGYGIDPDSLVIAYDEGDLAGPARLFVQGRYAGFDRIRVLDGGLLAWQKAGGAITTLPSSFVEKGKGIGHCKVREDLLYTLEETASKKDTTALLLDARARARYLGKIEPVYPRKGHIPGAYNLPYTEIRTEEGNLLSKEELEKAFAKFPEKEETILSCGSGVSACVLALAMERIKKPYHLYNGSYSEWVADEARPVETKENID